MEDQRELFSHSFLPLIFGERRKHPAGLERPFLLTFYAQTRDPGGDIPKEACIVNTGC